jgi:hypothetical protein
MKISLWVVTYRNPHDLNANLDSLFAADLPTSCDLQVNVINNHSEYKLNPAHWHRVITHHNHLRSDASLGHLSRNWNQALQLGFGSLVTPQADVVICCQDDVLWEPNWHDQVTQAAQSHDLITQGVGDAVIMYTPEAVRQVGMWDERFTPSFYHDGDYLLRALIHLRHKASINDPAHGRVWQPWHTSFAHVPDANAARVWAKNQSYGRARTPHQVWQHKWQVSPINWSPELMQNPPLRSECKNFITYPHFEMDVYNLADKNYLI